MNILFLDQFSELGGAQQCLLDLVPAVQDYGWKMTCAVPGNGPLAARLRAFGVTVHALALGRFTSGPKPAMDVLRFGLAAPRLARDISLLADESRADLVYVNGPRVLPAAAWAARKTGRPLLFHCHSHLAQHSAAMLAGRSLQLSNARVIACCRFVARPLWPYIDPGRLRVILNGAAPRNTSTPSHKSGCRIGVIGRISPEKGQVIFVRMAGLLAQKHPHGKFVVCGAPLFSDPEAERYSAQVHELATGLPVEFLGWREDVAAVLAGLDMLVVPSLREPGLPRVILEAWASRVPVVAFVTGGIPEIVTEGETGFLVEPPAAERLAEKLDWLLHNPEQPGAAADRAYQAWKENFTLDRYRREVLAAIETAASG